jgi:type IV pilus assembly protein PilV
MRLQTKFTPLNSPDARGFTLVEVLVALVVLSIGLLGMAKMVMVSSHSNDSAYLRSQATALAYQAMDSMRANLIASTANGYVTPMSGALPGPAPPDCSAACGNAGVALSDVYGWKLHLANVLPAGQGQITTSATFPVIATVVVQWDDSAAQKSIATATNSVAAANTQSITLQTVLQ